jgi:hypothetical protein
MKSCGKMYNASGKNLERKSSWQKCDSIVLKNLSSYFSTAKQSGSFGMAIILDNGNEEDKKTNPNAIIKKSME